MKQKESSELNLNAHVLLGQNDIESVIRLDISMAESIVPFIKKKRTHYNSYLNIFSSFKKFPSMLSVDSLLVLILAHLVLNLLYLPFTIIALAAGEWIFGSTDEQKTGTCYFLLFIFWWMVVTIFLMLTTISFEWFLFIVKPHLHMLFMRPWVALTLTIAIWILSAVSNIIYIIAFDSDIDPDLCYLLPININRRSVFAIVLTVFVQS
uniref:G-protein coupled receptors family 1 profile domain-containing protein n=1 Tax=Amphimedon queenslandica TaxID=400682 RepID=A0A1X7TV53_AMPQE